MSTREIRTHEVRTCDPLSPELHTPQDRTARARPRRRVLRRVAADGIAAVKNHLRFLVGRDEAGRWLALEDHGLAGGIFATKEAALHYASAETGRRPGGVRLARCAIAFRV